jgi:2-keto-4-pentenoate hydratase/2-oxohepta-3-ene-1,7-dioic acid hydratase in catechol pathway
MRIIRYAGVNGADAFASVDANGGYKGVQGDLRSGFVETGEAVNPSKILAPVAPAAIFCIGLNYRRHAAETNAKVPQYPVLFFKSPTAVQNPGDPILLPRTLRSEKVDYECELAVVIGKDCKNVSAEEALSCVVGYTCANDVSARDWQIEFGGSQWCRGKTFDTFCPLGPVLVTPDEIPDPNSLSIRTRLNGEVVQESHTSDMIFSVAEIIAFLSGSTTLPSGSVILTGTPEGVGMARKPPIWLKAGDEVEIEIEKIGSLVNPVAEE